MRAAQQKQELRDAVERFIGAETDEAAVPGDAPQAAAAAADAVCLARTTRHLALLDEVRRAAKDSVPDMLVELRRREQSYIGHLCGLLHDAQASLDALAHVHGTSFSLRERAAFDAVAAAAPNVTQAYERLHDVQALLSVMMGVGEDALAEDVVVAAQATLAVCGFPV